MASIILACVPIHGHVMPMLSVARGFIERGDDVRFITGAQFADRVRATGAVHIPLSPAGSFDVDEVTRLPERAKLKGTKAIAFDIERMFARPARGQYETVMTALAARPAEAILIDPAFTGWALLMGHAGTERPPVVVCGVIPLSLPSRDTAPFGTGLPPARWLNKRRNAALAAVNRRILSRANRVLDDQYKDVHGGDLPCFLTDCIAHADAVAQFTVPAFEYSRSDAQGNLHFVGPLSAAGSVAQFPDWWADLDCGRPVVHVTQGTIANSDYRQLIGPALDALADEDVLVVVSTGGPSVDLLPPLPANARAARYLPYDELLPRTSVFVTNGGYGGVQYALRYGVPIVATGGKEDKPEVGARVAWSGVGRRIRTERPSPAALRRDILAVLAQPQYRESSRRIAADMAAAPGFAGLARIIDDLTARPRSLI